jgi:hypothetical protein
MSGRSANRFQYGNSNIEPKYQGSFSVLTNVFDPEILEVFRYGRLNISQISG